MADGKMSINVTSFACDNKWLVTRVMRHYLVMNWGDDSVESKALPYRLLSRYSCIDRLFRFWGTTTSSRSSCSSSLVASQLDLPILALPWLIVADNNYITTFR